MLLSVVAFASDATIRGHSFFCNGDFPNAARLKITQSGVLIGSSVALTAKAIGTDLEVVGASQFTGAVTCSNLLGLGSFTVATLPSASANAGRIAQVTDSSVTTNGSAVAGGGSNRVMVFSNGTTWDVVVA
jgi:hypothetical protein